MLHPELEVLRQLFGHRGGITGIVKIIRLEPGEDHLIFVPVPHERAENRVRRPELLEKIKGDRHVFRRAQDGMAKGKTHQPLAVFALGNRRAGSLRPGGRIRHGKLGFALIQIHVDMLAQEGPDGGGGGLQFRPRKFVVAIRIYISPFQFRF